MKWERKWNQELPHNIKLFCISRSQARSLFEFDSDGLATDGFTVVNKVHVCTLISSDIWKKECFLFSHWLCQQTNQHCNNKISPLRGAGESLGSAKDPHSWKEQHLCLASYWRKSNILRLVWGELQCGILLFLIVFLFYLQLLYLVVLLWVIFCEHIITIALYVWTHFLK